VVFAVSVSPASAQASRAANKAADKCQKAIKKAGVKFVGKKLRILDKWRQRAARCVHTKAADGVACSVKAAEVQQRARQIASERSKLRDAITGKCASVSDFDLTGASGSARW